MKLFNLIVVGIALLLLLSGCKGKTSEFECRRVCSEHNMSYDSVSSSLVFDTGDTLVNCYCSRVIEVSKYEKKD